MSQGTEQDFLLIDGPYATPQRPIVVSQNIKDMLIDAGYTVLSVDEYKEKYKQHTDLKLDGNNADFIIIDEFTTRSMILPSLDTDLLPPQESQRLKDNTFIQQRMKRRRK